MARYRSRLRHSPTIFPGYRVFVVFQLMQLTPLFPLLSICVQSDWHNNHINKWFVILEKRQCHMITPPTIKTSVESCGINDNLAVPIISYNIVKWPVDTHTHNMWNYIRALLGVLCVLRSAACAVNCYSPFCRNTVTICLNFSINFSALDYMWPMIFFQSLSIMESQWKNTDDGGPQCLLTAIQNHSDCMNMKFSGVRHLPPSGMPPPDLKLSAYVYHETGTKTTAFNLTVKDINFQSN